MFNAAGLMKLRLPSASTPKIPSRADSRIIRLRSSDSANAFSASFRSVISRINPIYIFSSPITASETLSSTGNNSLFFRCAVTSRADPII